MRGHLLPYALVMNLRLLFLSCVLLACAPARNLDPFVERRPDPMIERGAHNSPLEWWYINGHIETPSGKTKTFALAVFQVLLPPETPYYLANIFSGPLFFGHYSFASATENSFLYSERSTFPNPRTGQAKFSGLAEQSRMNVQLGDWQIARSGNGDYQIRASLENSVALLNFNLRPLRPEVLHGPGWSGSKETGRMYYYSATRLEISGTLDGENVKGVAWLDHQWGGGVGTTGDSSASFTPRWDWFSLQLNDGRDLMVYQIRNAAGQVMDAFISETRGDGVSTESRKFKLQPFKYWTNQDGVRYPVAWTLKLEDGTLITMRASQDNQEVRTFNTTGFPYYEGAVELVGGVTGVGFVELTGYVPAQFSPFMNPFGYKGLN